MNSENQTAKELQKGYRECKMCKSLLLLDAGFEVKTSACTQCGQHVASRDEFFNVGGEMLSK